ncbi:MAG: class C sortase [Chitinophagaceae bacterium]|nr:class C sortase [Anaerolineae bacterium]
MRDKRPVDELSIEELERILAIKKREARQQQIQRMQRAGRVVDDGQQSVGQPTASKLGTEKPVPAVPLQVVTLEEQRFPPLNPVENKSNGQPTPSSAAAPVPSAKSAAPVMPPLRPVVRFDDDPDDVDELPRVRNSMGDRAWKLFVDRALVLVEIGAVVGLIYVAANLFGAIDTLQQETSAAQQMSEAQRLASVPTIPPTPTIRLEEVVLPSGHTFVNNQPVFNVAEIPAQLQARVQAQIITPVISRPPPSPETALLVEIPGINVRQTIVQGTDWEALRQGVGQALNGISPTDETGNVVLAAHNDIYGETFRYIEDLQIGDTFYINTEIGTYTYVVTETRIVEPTDVSVMDNVPGKATATLITCHPYGVNTQRYIVFAERQET